MPRHLTLLLCQDLIAYFAAIFLSVAALSRGYFSVVDTFFHGADDLFSAACVVDVLFHEVRRGEGRTPGG